MDRRLQAKCFCTVDAWIWMVGLMSLQGNNSVGRLAQTAVRDEVVPVIWLDWIKRVVDIGTATVGLTLFAPILLMASVAIGLDSGSPIFIRQTLPSRNNQAIRVFKFRVACAAGKGISQRVTRVGQILSLTGIDELPLLINVLRGEVSIVGRRNVRRWPTSIC
jgi:lipopolysaccharide/colanic/teichoic acid biosynthesis glycosyltransferase